MSENEGSLVDWIAEIKESLADTPPNVISAHGMIPLDPLDAERLPPPDLYDEPRRRCTRCEGRGEGYLNAGTPDEEPVMCPRCKGTGQV